MIDIEIAFAEDICLSFRYATERKIVVVRSVRGKVFCLGKKKPLGLLNKSVVEVHWVRRCWQHCVPVVFSRQENAPHLLHSWFAPVAVDFLVNKCDGSWAVLRRFHFTKILLFLFIY